MLKRLAVAESTTGRRRVPPMEMVVEAADGLNAALVLVVKNYNDALAIAIPPQAHFRFGRLRPWQQQLPA